MVTSGAAVISLLLPLAFGYRLLLLAAIVIWAYRAWHRYGRLDNGDSVQALQIDIRGRCYVRLAGDDRWQPAEILCHWLQPYLGVIVIKLTGQHSQTVLLPADAVDRQAFRRLRAGLVQAGSRG